MGTIVHYKFKKAAQLNKMYFFFIILSYLTHENAAKTHLVRSKIWIPVDNTVYFGVGKINREEKFMYFIKSCFNFKRNLYMIIWIGKFN